jgi:hypothetical protein
MRIKVISLHQPWASAMWLGLKKYETRSELFVKNTGLSHYSGLLGIHAAKKPFRVEDYKSAFHAGLKRYGLELGTLPYGVIGGICRMGEIYATENIRGTLSEQELFFGDYSEGRRAIHCHDMVRLEQPILLRGFQGAFYWDVPPEVERLVGPLLEVGQ